MEVINHFYFPIHYTCGLTVQSCLNPLHVLNNNNNKNKQNQKNAFLLSMYFLIADLSINLKSYIVLFHSNIYPYLNIIQSIFSTNLFKIMFY